MSVLNKVVKNKMAHGWGVGESEKCPKVSRIIWWPFTSYYIVSENKIPKIHYRFSKLICLLSRFRNDTKYNSSPDLKLTYCSGLQIQRWTVFAGDFEEDFVFQSSPSSRRLGNRNRKRTVCRSRMSSHELLSYGRSWFSRTGKPGKNTILVSIGIFKTRVRGS